jgi:Spy/CpxP family protein refolding chaperone
MKARATAGFVAAALLVAAAAQAQVPAPPAPEPMPPGEGFFYTAQGAGPAIAPTPRHQQRELGRWWKNSDIVRELQISEAQIGQIEQAFLDHRLKLIDLRAEVERQETRLQPLIEADQVDEAKVSAQVDQVLRAKMNLEKANVMMMLSIRKVLTVEQWKKLQEIQEHHGMMRRMPGPQPPGAMPRQPAPPRPPEAPGK